MPTSWSVIGRATERGQFCPQLRTVFSGRSRNVIEADAVFQAMKRGRSVRKIVQEAEQVEALFSGTLIIAVLFPGAAQSAGIVREFCVPDTPRHEADLI
jgi:hypothetical protein